MVWGRLERRDRNINVIAERIERIAPPADRTTDEAARVRQAVPAGQHFGRGRRG
jgi:hypothetical protein